MWLVDLTNGQLAFTFGGSGDHTAREAHLIVRPDGKELWTRSSVCECGPVALEQRCALCAEVHAIRCLLDTSPPKEGMCEYCGEMTTETVDEGVFAHELCVREEGSMIYDEEHGDRVD